MTMKRCGLCGRTSDRRICEPCMAKGVKPSVLSDTLSELVGGVAELDRLYKVAHDYGWETWVHGTEHVGGGDHSDPTASAALDPAHARTRAHATLAALLANQAQALMDRALGELQRGLPAEWQPEQAEVKAPGCISCARFEIWVPAAKGCGGRCRACYVYRSRHDLMDPPEAVIREREWSRASRRHEERLSDRRAG